AILQPISPVTVDQSVTLTAIVSARAPGSSTPTGTVEFFDVSSNLSLPGGTLGSAALVTSNGTSSATITVKSLDLGKTVIYAAYLGAIHNAPVLFPPGSTPTPEVSVWGNPESTSTTVAASDIPAVSRQSSRQLVTYTASVTSAGGESLSGTVTFYDG